MVTVGVLVRADLNFTEEVEARLAALDGVTTVELQEIGSIGLVIEGETLDEVHSRLCDDVQAARGVLAAWPLHVQLEP